MPELHEPGPPHGPGSPLDCSCSLLQFSCCIVGEKLRCEGQSRPGSELFYVKSGVFKWRSPVEDSQ
jgi:hypothetical protein